ncbi:MAG: hypothetical protein EWM47_00180 [Anaerolineaceae bacterium]|nr:MAG: hypothetical protein EWM47_00180 [Anaerolineaceae bacterium]
MKGMYDYGLRDNHTRENMEYTLLPKKEPFVKTYPKDANPLSVLLNYEHTYDWLMNCFIQLTSYNDAYLDYYDFNYRNCPILECQRIKSNIIFDKYETLTNFIIKSIDKGYYIILPVNMKYVYTYNCSEDIPHDIFVYGYNIKNKIFNISDNFFNGKYGDSLCEFSELENAYNNIIEEHYWFQGFRGCIELLSYISEKRACFELYRIKESIDDYLHSRPTSRWYLNHAMWTEDEIRKRSFGITCYNTLMYHINYAEQFGYFSQGANQAIFLMWEHKNIMLLRLKYMQDSRVYINNQVIEIYNQIEKQAKMCINLKLKYDITRNKNILKKMAMQYNEIEKHEVVALNMLLKHLVENRWI